MGAIFWYYMCMGDIFKKKCGSIDWDFLAGLSLMLSPIVINLMGVLMN